MDMMLGVSPVAHLQPSVRVENLRLDRVQALSWNSGHHWDLCCLLASSDAVADRARTKHQWQRCEES